MKLKSTLIVAVCCLAGMVSCSKIDVFEKNVSVPGNSWKYNFKPQFDFTIQDTAVFYNVYVVIRHTDAYRYNNIWLNVGITPPGESSISKRLEIQLGSDAEGWYGTGLDDIWEHRKLITNGPYQFKKAGGYKISVAQIMRENPLTNIMSVGVRVEKAR